MAPETKEKTEGDFRDLEEIVKCIQKLPDPITSKDSELKKLKKIKTAGRIFINVRENKPDMPPEGVKSTVQSIYKNETGEVLQDIVFYGGVQNAGHDPNKYK